MDTGCWVTAALGLPTGRSCFSTSSGNSLASGSSATPARISASSSGDGTSNSLPDLDWPVADGLLSQFGSDRADAREHDRRFVPGGVGRDSRAWCVCPTFHIKDLLITLGNRFISQHERIRRRRAQKTCPTWLDNLARNSRPAGQQCHHHARGSLCR